MSSNDLTTLARLIPVLGLKFTPEELAKRLNKAGIDLQDVAPIGGGRFTKVLEASYYARTAEGNWVQETREISTKGDRGSVVVLLYDPRADVVVMVSEQRIGTALYGATPMTLEFPTGGIGRNQTPRQAALNEAHDESGCTIKRLKNVFSELLVSAGRSDERMYGYIAEVDSTKIKKMVAGLASENERMRVHIVPVKDLFAMATKKKSELIMGTYAMTMWFKDNHEKFKREWTASKIALPRIPPRTIAKIQIRPAA